MEQICNLPSGVRDRGQIANLPHRLRLSGFDSGSTEKRPSPHSGSCTGTFEDRLAFICQPSSVMPHCQDRMSNYSHLMLQTLDHSLITFGPSHRARGLT